MTTPTDDRYSYELPEGRIATIPAEPRDSCKLLIYDTKSDKLTISLFSNIFEYLPAESFLVMNNTHVAPARLYCASPTKKKVEVFILVNELQPGETLVRAMVDRRIRVGETLVVLSGEGLLAGVPTNRRRGEVPQKGFTFEVVSQDRQYFMLKPNFAMSELTSVLIRFGTTPIPKYIGATPLNETELREKYQTVFTDPELKNATTHSVAAPTASLHFTEPLLEKLASRGVEQVMVTLHVGLGTFAPLTEENFTKKELFNEYYEVGPTAGAHIKALKDAHKKLIAVGTTAVRTLESYARTSAFTKGLGAQEATNIFIFPPFEFRLVDCLITNFHLPNSSLMMLVDALLTHKKAARSIKELYEFALKNDFKFYSFGDAMLIL